MAHVLLVDDDQFVVETLSSAITNKGHTLVTARDGKEGIRKFAEGRFDLVITDIIMPEKEGIETIMEMRRLAPGTRIVAMSGGGRTGNVDFLHMAEKLGATATLTKPIRLAEFYETLERCLSSAPEA
jgi:YesN/AraC family two-component response regulator